MDSTEVLTTARETAAQIQADPRMAVLAFNKRLLIESLEKEISDLSTQIEEGRTKWAQRIEEVTNVATEHANEVEWCEEFDRAMAEAGLDCKRRESVEVTFDVQITTDIEVSVDVTAQVESILEDIDGATSTSHDAEDSDVTVPVTVEFEATQTFEDVRTGECACGNVDRYPDRYTASQWSDEIEAFLDAHGMDTITISNTECENCS